MIVDFLRVLKSPVILMHVMVSGSGEPYTFSLCIKCESYDVAKKLFFF